MKTNEVPAENKYPSELLPDLHEVRTTNKLLELLLAEKTSELEEANCKLAVVQDELLEIDAIKTEFLTIISHEVRTSLNGILGSILLLKRRLKDSNCAGLLDILITSARRLEKFSLTALAITELKSGKRYLRMKSTDLNALIHGIIISCNCSWKQKDLIFDTSALSNDLIIQGDHQLLESCFMVILENAVQYSPMGGTIYINADHKGNAIVCDVTDEGPGFSELALRHLFKLFMPGEAHKDQNMGLDLTLARLIIEAHSGKIEIENLKTGGARVRIIFPALKLDLNRS